MTISSTTVRNSYSGDGSTDTFTYNFKIFQNSDIQVIIRSTDGTETIKTITTHYTVTGAGVSTGGSVIFTSGNIPTSTQTVVLRRNIPQTQAIDYIANDPFPAESHEEGLDRATMAIQQLQEELTRSIKLSKTNTMTSTEFSVGASDRANKILAFDTNGELSVTQELGTNRGSWSAGVTFNGRDIVKDGSNNNVYLCNTTHTSTGTTPISSNADVAKWDLIVDAQSATNSANAAANSAANSSNFANNSSNSANASANHASNSSNFANNASSSASNAAGSEASVAANASASANSAANSSNFANNSSNSANSASNHSSNSSNFANNSSNHASNSSNFANNSSNSANASSNHAANSSNFANNSSNSANASSNHASNSSNFANNSSNFANTSEVYSLTSGNHASNSSNFANNSSNFANTASDAANAANSARDAALASADNFDDVYLGAKANDPTLDNDGDALNAGDLYYNTTAGNLKYYTGSAWVAITSGGISDLVQDTTPQLGGDLDINTYKLVSTSNGNIELQPNGTGDVVLSADTVKVGDANTNATITTDGTGDLILNTNSGSSSGSITIKDGADQDIEITPNGTGVVKIDGLSYPTADGTANQVLKTNGSGILSFATISAGTPTVETFDTGTAATYTKPTTANWIQINIWGGGGSGGKGASNSPAGGGGGGAYNFLIVPFSYLAGAVTYTVGAGGAGKTAAGVGNAGGTTSVDIANYNGTGLTKTFYAYGGGAGGTNADGGRGGGGGGIYSAGGNAGTSSVNALIFGSNQSSPLASCGGFPSKYMSADLASGSAGIIPIVDVFGGGFGGASYNDGSGTSSTGIILNAGNACNKATYGGGGGGRGIDAAGNTDTNGGSSQYGGGGGGGAANSGTAGVGGTSQFGGSGSNGTVDANNSSAGTLPAGGSGGTEGGNSGDGASGRVQFIYW